MTEYFNGRDLVEIAKRTMDRGMDTGEKHIEDTIASHKVKSKYSLRLNLSCSLSENVPDWSTEVGGLNQVKE
jgi:hypothetical protein